MQQKISQNQERKTRAYLAKCLTLAKKGRPITSPNPLVGAVLVKNGKIIGQGYHRSFGKPHAEVEAISSCKNPRGATLYVNLEPCSHHGKTPPCTDLIIKSGIKEVVYCTRDPNPRMQGSEILKKHGIKTQTGIFEKEARELNAPFFKHQETGLPYITLKIASSMDFKIWSPTCKTITGPMSRKYVHLLRSHADGVIVGINTILKDNPHLTVRHLKGRDPTRIILDGKLRIPLNSHVLSDPNVIICATEAEAKRRLNKKNKLEKQGIKILTFPTLKNLKPILKKLASIGKINILVEGGRQLNTSFLEANLPDKILLFISGKQLGPRGLDAFSGSSLKNYRLKESIKFGGDSLLIIQRS
ncbi:MAG: hypothetical protein ACD_65C00057G0001 [uncultured bacterium]|nr:MAG: hypothetical protein ACD_65C00057G0001 [uncultured bacterium]